MIKSNRRNKALLTLVMVFIFCTNSFSMQIFVERTSGTAIILDVEPTDMIDVIKLKIFDQTGIPVEQQTIVFANKILEGGRSLADYNIQKEGTLYLTFPGTSSVPIPFGMVIVAFILIAILTIRHTKRVRLHS
jgi:ubiquitin-large subunit ribosomal protein L40e